jgi:hypothetical protein
MAAYLLMPWDPLGFARGRLFDQVAASLREPATFLREDNILS